MTVGQFLALPSLSPRKVNWLIRHHGYQGDYGIGLAQDLITASDLSSTHVRDTLRLVRRLVSIHLSPPPSLSSFSPSLCLSVSVSVSVCLCLSLSVSVCLSISLPLSVSLALSSLSLSPSSLSSCFSVFSFLCLLSSHFCSCRLPFCQSLSIILSLLASSNMHQAVPIDFVRLDEVCTALARQYCRCNDLSAAHVDPYYVVVYIRGESEHMMVFCLFLQVMLLVIAATPPKKKHNSSSITSI
eukprot:TRINITY_DN9881_c0_g1_i1.p1 TRINITY_DN9881_c0_g1~~TRINITY_DN9881_c0_g1_i1.p1  ORF type:complete len:242 (-),score=11.32 TRINITY_DN9881_c0_g1_i1:211-936(-)